MGLVAVRQMLSGGPPRHPQVWGGRLTGSRTPVEGQVRHSFPSGVVKAAGYVVGAVREPPGAGSLATAGGSGQTRDGVRGKREVERGTGGQVAG